jgi:RNA polymerase sigma-70 factor (ECF subfamily)
MTAKNIDTDTLLDRVVRGDLSAINVLIDRYRVRLRNFVTLRLDQRIAGRIDPSDVVQETLTTASQRLMQYAVDRPMPFYPWLRQLAIDRLVEIHRRHVHAQRRSVVREQDMHASPSDQSSVPLARVLASLNASPSAQLRQQEAIEQAQAAIEQLEQHDREVLVLRYLEQLTPREAAAVLGISENTFAQRHLRALRRVRALLEGEAGGADA